MTPTSRLTWEELRGRFHYSNLCNYYFTIEFYWFLWVFKWCFCDFLAIWTLSSTRRPCGTMRKFIRQKKHQVRGHFVPSINCSIYYLFFHLIVWQSRAQAFVEDSTAGVEEEQEERLLQSARCCQECHRGWDQKGLSQKSSDAPPRSVFVAFAEQKCFFFLKICIILVVSSKCLFCWHYRTDRHSSATAEVQKEEEKKFKEVGEAFTVLSDPKKKIRYDNGHDLDDDGGFSGRGISVFFSSSLVRWCGIILSLRKTCPRCLRGLHRVNAWASHIAIRLPVSLLCRCVVYTALMFATSSSLSLI